VRSTQDAALAVLEVVDMGNFPAPEHSTLEETLHIVALAAQFASLSFLSYSQGHIVPIHPFYLDTAPDRMHLLGSCAMLAAPHWLVAEPAQLSCLGDMLRSPVTVFGVRHKNPDGSVRPAVPALRHDMVARAEDLLGES
jgi:hypothetical protein